MELHSKCLVCKEENLKPLNEYYKKHGLIKCENCGFVFMEKIPTPQELNSFYMNYSYTSEGYLSPITVNSYNQLLDEFENFRKSNKILDVGCGRGWFLIEAQKRGWEVYGTEYSETGVKVCNLKGIKMKKGQLDASAFESKDFDVITSFEVIEHINNPGEELEQISSLLRKGGMFYCTTPNFNSLLRYYLKSEYNIIGYPEHLSYYTKSTLNKAVKQHAFKKWKFQSTGISITRIKTSKKKSNEGFISGESSDEILRKNIAKKWYLKLLKKIANKTLTLSNTGVTLKGYYIKQ